MKPLASMTEAELLAALRDPDWRIRNLYKIMDKSGKEVVFAPNEAQEAMLNDLWYRNIILKARQRGFSTLIQLMMLDTCLFNDNVRAAVIAQDQTASGTIFRDKIKFAYDRLPEIIKQMVPLTTDSKTELMLANNSSLQVATSVRSGTLQFLHVSEFGKICAKYPEKAKEVMTGSLPAVDQGGMVFIESTAEGREGAFFDMCALAQEDVQGGKKLTKLDMKFHFHSWWDAAEYEMDPEGVIVSSKDTTYFERLEVKIGRLLSDRKRAWYVTKRRTDFGDDSQMMKQEYPSTADEAFEQSTEGTYYVDQLGAARREGRIGLVPYDPRVPVNTFWDLGLNDETAIWFHQRVGIQDRWINYFEATGEPYNHYTKHMQDLGYTWGKHFLPHDGDKRNPGSTVIKTAADMLGELGLKDIEIVERTPDVTIGIQQTRNAFGNYWFDEQNCKVGIDHISLYKKEWNNRLGVYSDRPRHDSHSNAADGIRQHAQYYAPPSGAATRPKRRNRGGMAA